MASTSMHAGPSSEKLPEIPQRCVLCKVTSPFAVFPPTEDGSSSIACLRCNDPREERKRWKRLYMFMDADIKAARVDESRRKAAVAHKQRSTASERASDLQHQQRISLSNPARQHLSAPLQPNPGPYGSSSAPFRSSATTPYPDSGLILASPFDDLSPLSSLQSHGTGTPIMISHPQRTLAVPASDETVNLPKKRSINENGTHVIHLPRAGSSIPPTATTAVTSISVSSSSTPNEDVTMPWSLRCMPEPGRAAIWIKMHYTHITNSRIPQSEVYRHYRHSFPPLPERSPNDPLPLHLSGWDLVHLIPKVISGVEVGGQSNGYHFIGLARRHGMDVEALWRDAEEAVKAAKAGMNSA